MLCRLMHIDMKTQQAYRPFNMCVAEHTKEIQSKQFRQLTRCTDLCVEKMSMYKVIETYVGGLEERE